MSSNIIKMPRAKKTAPKKSTQNKDTEQNGSQEPVNIPAAKTKLNQAKIDKDGNIIFDKNTGIYVVNILKNGYTCSIPFQPDPVKMGSLAVNNIREHVKAALQMFPNDEELKKLAES